METKKKKRQSEINRDRRKHEAYKNDRSSFWADFTPSRKYGVYSPITSYKINGITALRAKTTHETYI
jgi:hypothetical protein